MAHAAPRRTGSFRRTAGTHPIPLAFLLLFLVMGIAALGPSTARGIPLSRNIFADAQNRPAVQLASGTGIPVGPERVDVGTPTAVRLAAESPKVSAALRFRALPDDPTGWSLTIFLTTLKHVREFYYLDKGQRAEGGRLVDQTSYYAHGLETALRAADEQGVTREVREITVQDDGEAEVRVALDGTVLVIMAVTPKEGGRPTPSPIRYGQGPPLRFQDYSLLIGGYTDNVLGELWIGDLVVARGSYFAGSEFNRTVGTVALTQQLWRWETVSVWMEVGYGFTQKSKEDGSRVYPGRSGLIWGPAAHWRYKSFGAEVNVHSTGGPTLAQVMGGWQFSERWGTQVYYQTVSESSGYGLAVSMNW